MTLAFSDPFAALPRGNYARPRGLGYGARIGDIWVRLTPSPETPIRPYTRDSLATRQAATSNPYENVLEIGYAFVRHDLSGGAGLDFFPRRDTLSVQDVDAIRFFDSQNVDVTYQDDDLTAIRLAHGYSAWYTAGSPILAITASDTKLYIAVGDTVSQFNDDADSSPDASQQLVAAQNIVVLDASPGDNAVALLANGDLYYKPRATNVWTLVPEPVAGDFDGLINVFMVKDRIIGVLQDPTDTAAATVLIEIGLVLTGSPGSPGITATKTEIDSFFSDVAFVIDAGIAVLAGTDDGYVRSYVPQTDTAGSPPVLTIRGKSPMPRGERPIGLGHNLGQLVVLTYNQSAQLAAYAGQMLDERFDYIIGDLQLLDRWTVDSIQTQAQVIATRSTLEWLVTEADMSTYVWTYDLATKGYHRRALASTAAGDELVYWREKPVFRQGANVVRRLNTYQVRGWLILPNVTFGLDTPINWLTSTIKALGIQEGQGAQVELWISNDPDAILDESHSTWNLIARISNAANAEIETNLKGRVSNTLAVKVVLYSTNSNANTPRVQRVGLRGIPLHRDWLLELPVSISDDIEVPHRRPYRIEGYGNRILTELHRLSGQHVEVKLLDPPVIIRGVMNAEVASIETIADRGGVGRTCVVQVIGVRLEEATSAGVTGNELVGMDTPGISIVGVGQSGVV